MKIITYLDFFGYLYFLGLDLDQIL